MDPAAPVELVKDLWRRYAEGGMPAALHLLDEDAVWAPHDIDGAAPLRGHREILARARSLAAPGVRIETTAHRFEDHDGCVVVTGRVRVLTPQGHYDMPMHWQVDVADGRITEIRAERRVEDARADCAA
jgi:ketosteroid isomerase-like protein